MIASGWPEKLGFERLGGGDQRQLLGAKARRFVGLKLAQLVAVGVGIEHRGARLRRPERHLLVVPDDAGGQDLVLQRILALRQLDRDDSALAGLAQPVEPLDLVRGGVAGLRLALGLGQRLELGAREEIAVAGDDLSLLGDLLLPHPDCAGLL